MEYVIGIDLGTSSLKGIVVNQLGEVCYTTSSSYSLEILHPGWSEQNPNDWIVALDRVLKTIVAEFPEAAEQTKGISFSGQMHSLVLLDEADRVIRPAILWNDVRTTAQCQDLMERFSDLLLTKMKNRAIEGFTLPKLLWVKQHEPEHWAQVAHFLLPKDYLGLYLTGNKQMEYSDAAGTLLLDIQNRVWSEEFITALELNPQIFPDLVSSTTSIGVLREELRQAYGFKEEIILFAGGADNACAALAAGITTQGKALASIGTSGVFLAYEQTGDKDYQGDLHYFNHAQEEAFYSMGVTLAAGYSLEWFKKNFASEQSFDQLLEGIEAVDPGANGLLFTPYLMGERSPYFDSQIRGSFIGIKAHHTFQHFLRAVLEGIVFSMKDSQVLMEKHFGKKFTRIVAVGGGAKNPEWLQMQANIFNVPIQTLHVEEGPAYGAAMIAAVGVGWFENMRACSDTFVRLSNTIEPMSQQAKKYDRVYAIYTKVYQATKDISHLLTREEEMHEQ